jgi:hypothetical protein
MHHWMFQICKQQKNLITHSSFWIILTILAPIQKGVCYLTSILDMHEM